MTQMTKKSLLGATLALFIISIPLLGMHIPDHVNPRVNELITKPFVAPEIIGEIKLNSYPNLNPNLEPDHDPIGFGCNNFIAALNQANIKTEQGWPLVPIKVSIPNPKKNAHDPQTYTNWTRHTPPIIKETIVYLDKQLSDRETELITLLGGYTITPENQAWWTAWDYKKAIERSNVRSKIRNMEKFPAVFPIHLLCHTSKITIDLFEKYTTTFTFNEHQKLAMLMEKFKTNDIATFSLLDSALVEKIKEESLQTGQGLAVDPSLSDATTRGLYRATMTTNANLIHNKVLDLNPDRNVLDKHSFNTVKPNLGIYTDRAYVFGEKSCTDIRPLLLQRELGDNNPALFALARQIGIRKPKTFTCSLKNKKDR